MNLQTQNNPNRYLIISFHDVAPHCQQDCQRFLERLKDIDIKNISMLAVPYWHNQESIEQHPSFLTWLKELHQQGYEITLHGHSHKAEAIQGGLWSQIIGRFYTNQEGEFYQIGYKQASDYIGRDRQLFEEAGIPIQGFIAPAWLLSDEACQAIRDKGFLYTTVLQHIEIFPLSERIYAPTLVFSSRSIWRRVVSILWNNIWSAWNRNTPVLRIAIHPIDLQYPHIEEALLQLIQDAARNRISVTYRDFAEQMINIQHGTI